MPAHDVATVPCVGAALVSVTGRAYPLESARIEARAEGGIASTLLVQTYANPYDEPLEVLYTLPLPADGAVLGYTIRMGERIIRGEVQPRAKAEAAYRDALFAGKTAGLLEQTRVDTFQQKLGNVPPQTSIELAIEVLHPLAYRTDPAADSRAPAAIAHPERAYDIAPPPEGPAPSWEYRFPTVVGVRYLGAPDRVPDASELSPNRAAPGEIPARCELSVTIADAGGRATHSPSHAIARAVEGACTRVCFDRPERLDRDIVLQWPAATDSVGARLVEGGGLPGDEGRYALVTLTPPAAPRARFARDLTVLIDASGSMDGQPIELARRVAGELLRSLEDGDRFELLAFSNEVRRLTGVLRPAGERALREALDALAELRAGGATEMADALREAMAPRRENAQRQVVLITDGYIAFESEAVAEVTRRENTRVHVVGIGSAPNRALTRQVATAGRGLELFAGDEAAAHQAARRLCAGTARPVLTGVTLNGDAVTGRRPRNLRDVYAGQPLVFTLELSPAGGAVELAGDLAAGETWRTRIDVPTTAGRTERASTPLPLGALHGRALIAELELELGAPGLNPAQDALVETLALRHGIASRCTSLVAIAEEPAADPRAPRRRERLAVEVPAGVSAEGAGLSTGVFPALAGRPSVRMMIAKHLTTDVRLDEIGEVTHAERPRDPAIPRAERPVGPGSPDAETMADARWLDAETLALEFEVPRDGLMLPDRTAQLFAPARGAAPEGIEVEIVRDSSSVPGPHARGLLVKLVVRVPASVTRAPGLRMKLSWTSRRRWPRKGALASVSFILPAAAAGGAQAQRE